MKKAPRTNADAIKSDIRALLTGRRYVPEQHLIIDGGMSLRDYFAGQALGGVLCNLSEMQADVRSDLPRIAHDCYLMADAMLAERDK